MKLLIVLFIGLLVITGCESEADKLEIIRKQAAADSLEKHQADSIKHAGVERLHEIQRKYDYPDFHFFYDDVSGFGYYDVETNSQNKPGNLWVKILHVGTIYFASVLYGENNAHSYLRAKIGDSIITSERVPIGSNGHIIESGVETVWFDDKDNGILKAIATSRDKKVKITLLGYGEYSYSLSPKDVEKLKDAIEFSEILKQLKLPVEEQN